MPPQIAIALIALVGAGVFVTLSRPVDELAVEEIARRPPVAPVQRDEEDPWGIGIGSASHYFRAGDSGEAFDASPEPAFEENFAGVETFEDPVTTAVEPATTITSGASSYPVPSTSGPYAAKFGFK